ncbi:MAG: hypothetical protein K2J20_03230 [Bacilli bacterium]|nr:hypothetical protein [Bacilli bacterium]
MTGIYYSDLFVINDKGCLIMGYGKSKTCRNFTGNTTKEICSDSIRLEKTEDRKLFGYADPGMGNFPFNKDREPHVSICYLIRMLNEEETKQLKCNNIIKIEKNEWIKLSDFNITFGVYNEKERREEFRLLIKDIELSCILVPWCKDMQTKGKMISDYIK